MESFGYVGTVAGLKQFLAEKLKAEENIED
jgi:hypothetical protein